MTVIVPGDRPDCAMPRGLVASGKYPFQLFPASVSHEVFRGLDLQTPASADLLRRVAQQDMG